MWSFTVLAPGMTSHRDAYVGVSSASEVSSAAASPEVSNINPAASEPQQAPPTPGTRIFSSLHWVMRGSYQQACSPSAAIAVDARDAADEAHRESNVAVVEASLASPNRIVLQTSSHAFSARSSVAKLTDPIDGTYITVDKNKLEARRMMGVGTPEDAVTEGGHGNTHQRENAHPLRTNHGNPQSAWGNVTGNIFVDGGLNPAVFPQLGTGNEYGIPAAPSVGTVKLPKKQSCRIVVQQLAPPSAESDNANATSGASAVDPDPSILIGLSCTYLGKDEESAPPPSNCPTAASSETQHQYDTRTLSTPLLWEEPRSYLIDCRRSGMYLWSEDGVEYGRKISDKCLESPKAPIETGVSVNSAASSSLSSPTNTTRPIPPPSTTIASQAEIELKWHDALHCNGLTDDEPQIKIRLLNRSDGSVGAKVSEAFTWRLPKGTVIRDLVPSVTFLTEYCRATILPSTSSE